MSTASPITPLAPSTTTATAAPRQPDDESHLEIDGVRYEFPRRAGRAEAIRLQYASPRKLEYVNGILYAMTGGSLPHGYVGVGLVVELATKLEGSECNVNGSDIKIAIDREGQRQSIYPDVSVVCGPPESPDDDPAAVSNPVVLIEVLSPSTYRYDHTGKYDLVRAIPTAREYLLVSQDRPCIERFVRDGTSWHFARATIGLDAVVTLTSLGVSLPLARIYRRVDFPEVTAEGDEHATGADADAASADNSESSDSSSTNGATS